MPETLSGPQGRRQMSDRWRRVRAPRAGDRCAARRGERPRQPVPLPPFVDSADPVQVHELGELYVCGSCGYRTRIKAEKAPDQPAKKDGE
jgi:hypothetical protein